VYADTARINLTAGVLDEEIITATARVYRILGMQPEELWPLTVSPRVPIEGWPENLVLKGWTLRNQTVR